MNTRCEMKIIALQGKSNIGKTTVVTKLYHKLCASYKRKSFHVENQDGDFTAIFDINSHIVGITSIGDKEKYLIEPFEIFEQNSCELCVVCCHKKHERHGSRDYVERKSKQYGANIIWYTKAYLQKWNAKCNIGAEMDIINEVQAGILLKEILLQI